MREVNHKAFLKIISDAWVFQYPINATPSFFLMSVCGKVWLPSHRKSQLLQIEQGRTDGATLYSRPCRFC
jgi:hypothetical protein